MLSRRLGTTWNLRTSLKAGSRGMRSMLQQREIKRETAERDKEREREVMDFAGIWRILLFLEGFSIKFWQTFMVRWMWPGPFQSNGMQMSCAADSRGTFWCGRVDLSRSLLFYFFSIQTYFWPNQLQLKSLDGLGRLELRGGKYCSLWNSHDRIHLHEE